MPVRRYLRNCRYGLLRLHLKSGGVIVFNPIGTGAGSCHAAGEQSETKRCQRRFLRQWMTSQLLSGALSKARLYQSNKSYDAWHGLRFLMS